MGKVFCFLFIYFLQHTTSENELLQMLYLKLFLQLLPQIVELLQTLAQVDVSVELDEGLDEIRHGPLGFDLIAAKEQTQG